MTMGAAVVDLELVKFRWRRRFSDIRIGESPCFDTDDTSRWFLQRLADSKRYLEFGTGGSTYSAAKLGVEFVAVDSDRVFLDAVRAKIDGDGYGLPDGQTFTYADIGVTGPWGRPVGANTPARLDNFRRYSDPPAQCLAGGRLPDLILVDGRFRVACALKTLRMLRHNHDWTMLVDDYTDRPADHVIAEFADFVQLVGRMAVFRAPASVDGDELDRAIAAYETVLD